MKYLVVMEVSKKQRYIFNTNKLSRNVGASIIIRTLTGEEELQRNNGMIPFPDDYLGKGRHVFAGGGKSIYEFDTDDDAKNFIKAFSTSVVKNCPGVELFMAKVSYDPSGEMIENAIERLYDNLDEKKSQRQGEFCYIGPGCAKTSAELRRLAVEIREGQALSAEEIFKSDVTLKMQDEFFSSLLPEGSYRFAKEFEELGGIRGTKDYIAVIAVDGNKMGQKISSFADTFQKNHSNQGDLTEYNESYKKEFRAFSENLDKSYRNAVSRAISKVAESVNDLIEKDSISFNMDPDGKMILPLRPLILSGDDICIVCNAKISISLAKTILEEIEKEKPSGMSLHACAGVAMVHSHYPFSRAHELAEELCSNAKSILPLETEKDESVMDFLIVQGEITGDLGEIRRVQYRDSRLTDKPLYLHEGDGRRNSMPYYHERMQELTKTTARSKLKGYRDALYEGRARSQEYVDYMRMGGSDGAAFVDRGYDSRNGEEHSIDFDLIEIMDLDASIEKEN